MLPTLGYPENRQLAGASRRYVENNSETLSPNLKTPGHEPWPSSSFSNSDSQSLLVAPVHRYETLI